MRAYFRPLLAAVAAILWLGSFFLPAVQFGGNVWEVGGMVALMGLGGPLMLQFGAYANLFMIPGLHMLALGEARGGFDGRSKLGLLLFLLWVDALFWTKVPSDGGPAFIDARGAGYYAWMASVLIVWLGLLVVSRLAPTTSDATNPS